jgi:hypothetical protein
MKNSMNQPFGKLNAEDLQSIQYVMREFCSTHDAHTIYTVLWDMLKESLCSAGANHWDEQKRADYIFAYETLLQLIGASYALVDHWNKPPN